ncbi:CHAT domain-containing protein [Methanobrevibacter sp. UBA188]|uniref:CHAT domain-containing protein n=1 Tax=Methanobrevibacter sp. UBA188 TaxID=1915473 RepID=UPI0025EE514F|nr:CHAT domain-containing protein [Methanobrevibacter sp. UBA188]
MSNLDPLILSRALMDHIILSQSKVLEKAIRNPNDLDSLYWYLEQTISLKSIINKYCLQNLILTFVECITRQKIQEFQNKLSISLSELEMARICAKEIQEIYINLNIEYNIDNLVGMQEEAIILTKLAKIEGSVDKLNTALILFQIVKNETKDKQLCHLAMMNEANLRLQFAIEKINPKQNCLKSIELSEKARNYYTKNHKYHKRILNNQLNAMIEFEINETSGFGIENKKRIIKLIEKIKPSANINNLRLRLNLINAGINPISDLDSIYSDIQKLKQNTPISNFNHHRSIILEGDILIEKAVNSKNKIFLSESIHLYMKYRRENKFEDKYYEAQSLYKEAYARLLFFKETLEKSELYKSSQLILEAKTFYEETPFQNQIIHLPKVLYYSALIKKEIYLLDKTLPENYLEIKDLLINSINDFEKRNDYDNIINSYLELGQLFYDINYYGKAYEYLNKGIQLIEEMRNSIINLNYKSIFFEKQEKVYELMIKTCCHLNYKKSALKFIELTKQRIFIDKLIINQRKNPLNSKNPDLINKLNNIQEKISMMNNELNNIENNNFKCSELYEKILNYRKEQSKIINKIKKEDSKYYEDYFKTTFDYSTLKLHDKTLIEYYYNEEFLLIFLIDDKQFIMKKINSNKLDEFFTSLNRVIIEIRYEKKHLSKFKNLLKDFYDILIKPIKNNIRKKQLIIIPYGKLHNVPYNCLLNEDYLINEFEITIIQSATSIKYLKNNPTSNKDCLVIGNTLGDLENSEIEVKNVAEKLKTKPITYKNATKKYILKEMKNKKIIHYSGHGRFYPDNPDDSYLTLYDAKLTVKDLQNKNINSELIVLSSCETGLVSVSGMDENKGLVNYLQIDGSRYIIAPLWSVDDENTARLFEDFYSSNKTYAEKLRKTQLKLKKELDVYEWGAFQIYGI